MKIEPIEIEQDEYFNLYVDVSSETMVEISNDDVYIQIERAKIQELIDILEHEKA